MQYLFCTMCFKAKDRMIIRGGNSYCFDCLQITQPKRDEDPEGLSALFST